MARSTSGDPFGSRCVQVRALQLGSTQQCCPAAVTVEQQQRLLLQLLPDDEITHNDQGNHAWHII